MRFKRFILAFILIALFAIPNALSASATVWEDELSLTASTDTISTMSVDIRDVDYVGIDVGVAISADGGSGDATLYIQGSTTSGIGWTDLYVIDYTDSCSVVSSKTLSGASDLHYSYIVTGLPVSLDATTNLVSNVLELGNFLPYTKIRVRIEDPATAWNAVATVTVRFLLR